MKTAKKVLHVFMIAVVCCFIVFTAVKLVKSLIMKQPLAHTCGYATVTIKDGAGSMSPTLMPGDTLLIKKQKAYEVGDIITFYDQGINGLTTHRVVEVTAEGYITQGDANNARDSAVILQENVQGKMIDVLSGFEKYCLSIWGFLTLVLIIFAIDTGFGMMVNKKLGMPIGADEDDNYEIVEDTTTTDDNLQSDGGEEVFMGSVDVKHKEDK